MIIKADKEGIKAIAELCDATLKALGLQANQKINIIIGSLQEIKEEDVVKQTPILITEDESKI